MLVYGELAVASSTVSRLSGLEMSILNLKQAIDPTQVFCVMLHDVAPRFQPEVDQFVAALSPVIGNSMTAGVVPCWAGEPITDRDRPFLERVQRGFGNLVLHGYTHTRQRGRGFVSRVAAGLDEMNGLSLDETEERLRLGQQVMQHWFGEPARGFIAPTFQIGNATPERLARHGVRYTVGYRYLVDAEGRRQRLATWCWDVSPLSLLNHAGYWLGELNYRLRRTAIPCLALHPLDLGRGFLPKIVRTVEMLLKAGRAPILLESHGLVSPSVAGVMA